MEEGMSVCMRDTELRPWEAREKEMEDRTFRHGYSYGIDT